MELIRGIHNLRPRHRGCVATIGNFDGVHLGHQAVLGQLSDEALKAGLPSTVITFEPYPREYFAPDRAPPRLMRLREKVQALRRFGAERILVLHFNRALAQMPAETFIERVLVEGLGVRYLVVGDDFRFGHERRGDFEMLREAGARMGFETVNMHSCIVDGARVSSTRVREALGRGDLAAAERLLGRPFRISGRVAHGDERGRTIGFPTANLLLHRHVVPVLGVYVVEVFGIAGEPWPAVANVGTRPTLDGRRIVLEVHLLDFDGDLYKRHLDIDFLARLRDEQKFDGVEALRRQIGRDVEAARAFFHERRGA